jgi:hypothetical protein
VEKQTKILLVLGSAAILVFGVVFGLFYLNENTITEPSSDTRRFHEPSNIKIEITPKEDRFAIGTKAVSRGSFVEVKNGMIYYGEYVLPLAEDEIALVCTGQDLSQAEEVNYELSTDVIILTPSTISEFIMQGEPIVVFADENRGPLTAHTIAISSEACSQ